MKSYRSLGETPGLLLSTWLCTIATVCALGGESPPCRAEPADYRGWRCLRLSNGLVTLHVAPDIGGRIIQLQLGDHPFFFVDPELAGKVFPPEENGGGKGGWKNYGGSKLWPAPQGWENDEQWPGPPDPILDGGRYRGEVQANTPGEASVLLTGPSDPRTGIQFSRVIRLFRGATRIELLCSMKNISKRPVRWAIWEVTQLDTAEPNDPARWNNDFWAFCPLNRRSIHPKGFYPMFGQVNHPSFRTDPVNGLLVVKYDHRVGKVGLDSNAGWLAAVNGGSDHCFVGQFDYDTGALYPDNASVEFWLNGAGEFIVNGLAITNAPSPRETPYLMEAEILSPLVKLEPDVSYDFRIVWHVTRCPKPVVDVMPAGVVSRRLTASRQGDAVQLEGVFGVFYPGNIEASIMASDGKALARHDLGPASPDRVLRVSAPLPLPAAAFRISLVLRDEAGDDRGALGNVILKDSSPNAD